MFIFEEMLLNAPENYMNKKECDLYKVQKNALSHHMIPVILPMILDTKKCIFGKLRNTWRKENEENKEKAEPGNDILIITIRNSSFN